MKLRNDGNEDHGPKARSRRWDRILMASDKSDIGRCAPPIHKKYDAFLTKYWLDGDGRRIHFHNLTTREGIK